MDPVSQAFIGASGAQLGLSKSQDKNAPFKTALFLGALSGMAPDLDIFIRSSSDPLLALEFHRQFTHSLIFVPFGALICALVLYWFVRKFVRFKQAYLFCFLGYLTHGLLDACTSYGTLLFWPFSHMRVGWNNISIIDPLFTLPLVTFVLIATFKKRKKIATYGFVYALLYLGLGFVQHYRVKQEVITIAEKRGHFPSKISVSPSFANLLVWRSIYLHNNQFYIDGIRAGIDYSLYTGGVIDRLDEEKQLPWLNKSSQQYRDIQRFKWFSKGYTSFDGSSIMDLRYGLLPNDVSGAWKITPQKQKAEKEHVEFTHIRDSKTNIKDAFSDLFKMILGTYKS